MRPKKLALALQARVPGLAYQAALRMVTTREVPTLELAAALTEVLRDAAGRGASVRDVTCAPPFNTNTCRRCGGPMSLGYIDSSKMLLDPAPAVTRWVEGSCERQCEGSRLQQSVSPRRNT